MKKILVSLLLVIALTFTMAPSVLAQDLTEFLEMYRAVKEEEQRRVEEIQQSPDSKAWIGVFRENMPLDDVSTYRMCVDCSWFTVNVCAGDATLVYEGYHTGLFGFITSDCYAYYYRSRGAEMCPTCYTVIQLYEGEHDCFQVHEKCSKGTYDTCPMDVT